MNCFCKKLWKTTCSVFVLSAMILPCLLVTSTTPLRAAEIFVAPAGDDANPGTIEKPLATLEGAKKQVQKIKGSTTGPITVNLRAGTYYLTSPIVFNPSDSGTKDAPITYSAYSKEKVVISGGEQIKPKWTPHTDGIVKAQVPRHQFDQLFVNGKRRIMARWPNRKIDERGVDVGYSDGMAEPTNPIQQLTYDPKKFSLRKWKRPSEAILHIFQSMHWGNMQWRLRDIDYKTNTIILGEGGDQLGTLWFAERAVYVKPNSRFYVENVFEELDAPGEWYYDNQDETLYYKPVQGEDPAKAIFHTAGQLKELVRFSGESHAGLPTKSVTNVRLEKLTFMHTARIFLEPYETRLRGDWAIARLGAVRFDGAEDCHVTECFFDAVGGNGVFISNYARRVNIEACHFKESGESAICLVGNDDAVRNLGNHKIRYANLEGIDPTPGPRTPNYPSECRIMNNLMHELGVFGKQTAAVYISAASKIFVEHNTIYHTPRAGICINDGCWGGHSIAFNDVFQTVRETGDHGPFNSWGRDRYWQSYHRDGLDCDMTLSRKLAKLDNYNPTVIQNNRFVHETKRHSWGIDLDDGSSNYVVRNNLCMGCAVKLREGYFRTVENNIFITPRAPAKQCCFEGSDDVITRNIIVTLGGNWGLVDMQLLPKLSDYNLFYNYTGEPPVFRFRGNRHGDNIKTKMTFAEVKAIGLDKNSIFANPQFVAPEKGDFTVKPTSPALKLGFKNIPMDGFGTQYPPYKAIVKTVPRKLTLVNGELK